MSLARDFLTGKLAPPAQQAVYEARLEKAKLEAPSTIRVKVPAEWYEDNAKAGRDNSKLKRAAYERAQEKVMQKLGRPAGVFWCPRYKMYEARIYIAGNRIRVGYYSTEQEAIDARRDAILCTKICKTFALNVMYRCCCFTA